MDVPTLFTLAVKNIHYLLIFSKRETLPFAFRRDMVLETGALAHALKMEEDTAISWDGKRLCVSLAINLGVTSTDEIQMIVEMLKIEGWHCRDARTFGRDYPKAIPENWLG